MTPRPTSSPDTQWKPSVAGLAITALWALLAGPAAAQISPPGLGEAETASWSALGLRQELDAARQLSSLTYLGVGSVGDSDAPQPWHKPALFVINEELTQRLSAAWWYAVALSYRRQNEYQHESPFEEAPPTHELRLYARVSHVLARGPLKLTHTLRPETRTFFAADAAPNDTLLQFRLRLRSQLAWSLDRQGAQRVVASAELLGSVSRARAASPGDHFDYRESRFCLYYSRRLSRAPLSIDIGYMNNLLGKGSPRSVHYLAIDVVWENPFGARGVTGQPLN